MPIRVTTGTNLFQSQAVRELTQVSLSPQAVIRFKLQRETFLERFSSFQKINRALFHLKVKADLLSGQAFSQITGISSQPFAVRAGSLFFQGPTENALVSRSAAEITGDPEATSYTRFEVRGSLSLNGQRIFQFDEGKSISLQEIAFLINSKKIGLEAEIIKERLVVTKSDAELITVSDTTGKIGLRTVLSVPEKELRQFLQSPFQNEKEALTFFQTLSASELTGNASATAATPLYGIKGKITINGQVIGVGENGVFDSLSSLASRIEKRLPSVKTQIKENRLILYTLFGELQVNDQTEGGAQGQGLGIGRIAESRFSSPLSGAFFHQNSTRVVAALRREVRLSFTAASITGNSSADETEALGLSGELVINGITLHLYNTQSLQDIATLINALVEGVEAKINGNRLLVTTVEGSPVDLEIEDRTTGGLKDGLGLSRKALSMQSLAVSLINGDSRATEFSLLLLDGELRINHPSLASPEVFVLGLKNSTDTLHQLAETINANGRLSGLIQAKVEDGKLVLLSLDGTPFTVEDSSFGTAAGTRTGFGFSNPAQIIQPQGTLVEIEGKSLQFPEDYSFTLAGGQFAVLDEETGALLQVTDRDNRSFLQEEALGFFNAVNVALKELRNQTRKTDGGEFKNNASLQNLYQELQKILSQREEDLGKIGVTLKRRRDGQIEAVKLNEQDFTKELLRNPHRVFELLEDQEGVASEVSRLLEGIVFGDGIPKVFFEKRKPLGFLSFSLPPFPGSLVDTAA